MYEWGGAWVYGEEMNDTALWKFAADGKGGGAWSVETPGNPGTFSALHPGEWAAFASTNTTGFAIGGVTTGWS